MTYVFFLGRQTLLAAVEAWHVLQSLAVQDVTYQAPYLFVETAQELTGDQLLPRLGGTNRIAHLLGQQSQPWTAPDVLAALAPLPPKLTVGLSTAGRMPRGAMKPLAIALKKQARAAGTRLTFILPKGGTAQLNAAQLIFNNLTAAPNRELTLLNRNGQYSLLETVAIQDIVAYEARDTQRPRRGGRVGMLPPKLAQTMLNLATAQVKPQATGPLTILDPFCGFGTVLQEGWLLGHRMLGSDISAARADDSRANLAWLQQLFPRQSADLPDVIQHDAARPFPTEWHGSIDAIVTEPHLGKPQLAALSPAEAKQQTDNLTAVYRQALTAFLPLLHPGSVVLMLLPTFRTAGQPDNRPTLFPDSFLDEVRHTGYGLIHPVPQQWDVASDRPVLHYARPDAYVGREITLWKRL